MDQYREETCRCGSKVKFKVDPVMDSFLSFLEVKTTIAGCPACTELEGVETQEDFNNKYPNL